MMMSGSGASTCAAAWSRHQPNDRDHHDHRPSGTSPARRTGPGTCVSVISLGRLRLTPVEQCAVNPDAVENNGDFPGDGDLRLLHADAFCELHAPGLEGRPFLCPIKNGRGLELWRIRKTSLRSPADHLSHQFYAVANLANDLFDHHSIFRQHQDRRIGLLPAQIPSY